MIYKWLIFSALVLLVSTAWTQSFKPFVLKDSLFLELESTNLAYFNYKVNKNQTLYHLSKKFHVEVDSLKWLNKEIKNIGLRENMLLKIPLNKTQLVFEISQGQENYVGLFYKIKPGESLYKLSKRTLEIDLQKLIHLNKLKNSTIREGTILLLGFYKLNDKEPLPDLIENRMPAFNAEEPRIDLEVFTKQSRGVAICEYDQLGSGRMFALHNTAAMDSEIEIENPVLNKKVYAKVIGRIPPIYERDIQIIVSAEVARMLSAVDKRFFVSLRYR